MRYVIMGADGKLGGRVAQQVLEATADDHLVFTAPAPERISALTRDRWRKAGVELRQLSYDNPEQMASIFQAGDRVFFVSSILNGPKRVRQHRNVIDALTSAHIGHVTYTSFFGANREGYNQYVLPDHRATEGFLRESGLNYSIMRNNLYMDNYTTTSVMLALLSDNV